MTSRENNGYMILTVHFYAFRRLRYSWYFIWK